MTALTASQIVCVLFFSCSVFLEMLAASARPAGSIAGKNAMGYTVAVIINTFKRVFMVAHPPVLGLVAVIGTFDDLVLTIFLCYLFSGFAMAAATALRFVTLAFLVRLIVLYSKTGRLIFSVKCAAFGRQRARFFIAKKIEDFFAANCGRRLLIHFDRRIVVMAAWVLTFYSVSVFSINILGEYFQRYSSIIYQLVGVVNAAGTLVWSFVLDPVLSRRFDASRDVMGAYNSLILANWFANLLLAPLFIFLLLLVLYFVNGVLI